MVEEMSIRGICRNRTRSAPAIRPRVIPIAVPGPPPPRGPGRPPDSDPDRVRGARATLEDRKRRQLQNLQRLVPVRQRQRLVSSKDQEQLVVRLALAQLPKRVDGVGRTFALELDPRHSEALIAHRRQLGHLEASLGTGILLDLAMRRHASRNPNHDIQPKLRVRLLGSDQMPVVRRVEDAAVDPDTHYVRIWPEPSTMYL